MKTIAIIPRSTLPRRLSRQIADWILLSLLAGLSSLPYVPLRPTGTRPLRNPVPALITVTEPPCIRPPVPMTKHFAVPVLMYHRICDLTPKEQRSELMRDLTVSPARFEQQVKYLVDHGFTFLLAREVEEAAREYRPLPEKAVVLTMDDGYKDNFACAFPILQKYHVPATIFLVTNTVNTDGHLSWDNVLVMQKRQVGYGSHTVHHYDLPALTPREVDYELRESKRVLESRLVEKITAVAYPSGQYNRMVAAKARAVGYLAGWKKGGGPVQPGMDSYLLPRVRVNGGTNMKDFKRKVFSGLYTLEEHQARQQRLMTRLTRRRHKETG